MEGTHLPLQALDCGNLLKLLSRDTIRAKEVAELLGVTRATGGRQFLMLCARKWRVQGPDKATGYVNVQSRVSLIETATMSIQYDRNLHGPTTAAPKLPVKRLRGRFTALVEKPNRSPYCAAGAEDHTFIKSGRAVLYPEGFVDGWADAETRCRVREVTPVQLARPSYR